MSWYRYCKIKRLLKTVKLVGTSPQFNHFHVGKKEYSVLIPNKEGEKLGKKPSCTCEYFSLWGMQKECTHIKSTKLWLQGKDLEDQT